MKTSFIIIIAIIAILAGYVLGNIFPFKPFDFALTTNSEKGILGDNKLIITAKMEDTNNPVPNLEIDLATQPGPPPVGGVALTDESGVAEFSVKPGKYFIYFNDNTFPKNLKIPEPEEITIVEGIVNEKEILFYLK